MPKLQFDTTILDDIRITVDDDATFPIEITASLYERPFSVKEIRALRRALKAAIRAAKA